MIDSRWADRLRQPGALPALPEALVQLQQGLHDLDVDIDKLCDVLAQDAALVSEILKTINSPLFGIPRDVRSLKQAVVLLGLRRVRAIILSQSLRQSLATYNSPGFSLFHWWDRSLLSAVAAAMLAQNAAPDMAEEAYLAALIADTGVLVLARFEPEYQSLLRRFAGRAGCDLDDAESGIVGIEHSALAGEIFSHWRLPEQVATAARYHHDPDVMGKDSHLLLPRLVYFACLLTDCVVSRRSDLSDQLRHLAADHFYMGRAELGEYAGRCVTRYRVLSRVLGHGDLGGWDVPPALAVTA